MKYDEKGLIPFIIQDNESREVLMLGYANEQAYLLTKETGIVHFWSRSRKKLWKKGGTSGRILYVVHMSLDCDEDAVLIEVKTNHPTCHLTADEVETSGSCFSTKSSFHE